MSLLDDRTFIQVPGHVVACGADDFDTPLVCLFVRVGACERGKEGMVNIDDAVGVLLDKPRERICM